MKGERRKDEYANITAADYQRDLLKLGGEYVQSTLIAVNILRSRITASAIRTALPEVKNPTPVLSNTSPQKRTTVNEPEFLQSGNMDEESKIEMIVKNEKNGQVVPLRKREDAVLIKSVEDRFEDAFEDYLRPAGSDTGLEFHPRSIMPEVANFKDRRTIWGRMDFFNERDVYVTSDKECNLVVIPPGHPRLNSKYGLPEFVTLKGQVSLLIRPQVISREWAAVNLAYFLPVMHGYDQSRSRVMAGGRDLTDDEDMHLMSAASVEQIALVQRMTKGKFLENLERVYRRWDRSKMTKLMLFGEGRAKKIARNMYTEMGLQGFLNEPENLVERAIQTQVALSGINIITAAADARKHGIVFLDRLAQIFRAAE